MTNKAPLCHKAKIIQGLHVHETLSLKEGGNISWFSLLVFTCNTQVKPRNVDKHCMVARASPSSLPLSLSLPPYIFPHPPRVIPSPPRTDFASIPPPSPPLGLRCLAEFQGGSASFIPYFEGMQEWREFACSGHSDLMSIRLAAWWGKGSEK